MNGFRPLSLAQHFEAPDNHRCCFGWLCGYSADAAFLDDAAERFTRQTRRSRESSGGISWPLPWCHQFPSVLTHRE